MIANPRVIRNVIVGKTFTNLLPVFASEIFVIKDGTLNSDKNLSNTLGDVNVEIHQEIDIGWMHEYIHQGIILGKAFKYHFPSAAESDGKLFMGRGVFLQTAVKNKIVPFIKHTVEKWQKRGIYVFLYIMVFFQSQVVLYRGQAIFV